LTEKLTETETEMNFKTEISLRHSRAFSFKHWGLVSPASSEWV